MPFVWAKGLDKDSNRRYFHLGPTFFSLNIGRGCSGNCTWCGGGAKAQKVVNGRSAVVFRSPEQVADTVAEAQACGYEMMHIAFDPGKEAERYYETLLPILMKKASKVKCYFESFSLPSERFLNVFADTFDCRGSILALSPETGKESLRHRNKSFSFSNDALMETIGRAEKLGLRVDLFFAMGIAGETHADLLATQRLRSEICRRFKNIGRIWTSPISMEPAAPWYIEPERFGIVATRRSFEDFVKAGSPSGSGLGYFIPGYYTGQPDSDSEAFEVLLKSEKCRRHCGLHPNPAKYASPLMGRLHCFFMNQRTRGGS
ncbi:MAG: radical SAM protein [Anaerolineaceae bacterium]|nr:radical SAM protein [Anaerolineaceae bacterium]